MPDKHTLAPPVVKALTELEKTKLIEIASESDVVKTRISGEFNISFQWVAVYGNGGSSGLEYDIFETGIRDNLPLAATIYPAVVFENGSYRARITIDLSSSAVMDSDTNPVRRGPTPVHD
jgi:hypothetical protein